MAIQLTRMFESSFAIERAYLFLKTGYMQSNPYTVFSYALLFVFTLLCGYFSTDACLKSAWYIVGMPYIYVCVALAASLFG